jgi:hypothetical protein
MTNIEYAEVTEIDRVVNFRLQWLLHAGYKTRNAEKIANDLSVDWHFACDLRGKCSDERLCMKIIFGDLK